MIVIIHGWSDTHQSFSRLGKRLVAEGVGQDIAHVRLGDYVSLDDDITFDDLSHALQRAWIKEELSVKPRSVDIVVHSTGGLVVRHWMTTFFKPTTNPIRRLLMLAPANFGSPIAHKGRSFVGRVVKGFKSDKLFQTGTHILKGLELASPFSSELAMRDRFSSDCWYGPDRVLATVLVGTSGYTGISAAANENGSDGTVRVSTANLNPALVTFDFSEDPQKPKQSFREANGMTAFARVPGENHSTIALKDNGPKNSSTVEFMKRALTVTDNQFPVLIDDLEKFSEQSRAAGSERAFTQGYQNTVLQLKDDMGAFITDYFLEVFSKQLPEEKKIDEKVTCIIQEDILGKVHAYDDNASFRSLLFNTTALKTLILDQNRSLFVSLTAMPDIRKTQTVGYSTFGYDDIGSIKLTKTKLEKVFKADRTVFIDLIIKREQTDKVFKLLSLK